MARKRYVGDDARAALEAFRIGNRYPEGIIELTFADPGADRHAPSRSAPDSADIVTARFPTTGSSRWADWANATGWAATGLFVAGALASAIPGGQVAAPFVTVGALFCLRRCERRYRLGRVSS